MAHGESLLSLTRRSDEPFLNEAWVFGCSVDKFYAECDPELENLCLYGHSDGTWEVDLPAEEVPPEMPEPALGINFARDGMQVGGQ
jgi:Alfin